MSKQHNYNFIVQGVIISDFVYWISWNFLAPLFSVFVVSEITGGNLQIVTSSFSLNLIVRMIAVMGAGKFFNHRSEKIRLFAVIFGNLLMSLSYIILAYIDSISAIYLFYALAGLGMGIADPLKLTIFVQNVDKNVECEESGLWQSSSLLGSAIASFIGGLIVQFWGFRVLFSFAALVNMISLIPYVLILDHKGH